MQKHYFWAGGVTLIATGVGAGVGVAAIMAGSGTIGCGVAQIVDGAANDGKNNVPSGLVELVAADADIAFGNEIPNPFIQSNDKQYNPYDRSTDPSKGGFFKLC